MPPLPRWVAGLFAVLLIGCAHRQQRLPEPSVARAAAWSQPTTTEQNLVAFARLYGYVRFFHPTDASYEADWRHLAVAGVERVRDARTTAQLAQRLESLLRPLAPSLQLWVDGEVPPPEPSTPHRRDGLVFWQYQGFPSSHGSVHHAPYSKVRVQPDQSWRRRFVEAPAPDTRVQTQLAPRLWMRLPVVLDSAQASHAVHAPSPPLAPGLDLDRSHDSLSVRQAAVIEVWNVLRHFYPYQQELRLDWTAMLESSLRDAEDDADIADVRDTLRGLLEPLEDGHGFVGHQRAGPGGLAPVRIELVEDQPVVTGTRDPERFAIGDVVRRIGGSPARAHILKIAEQLSGTPQWRRFRAAAWEALRADLETPLELTLERDGAERRVRVQPERAELPRPPRPPAVHTFEDGVEYVDLTRATWPEVRARLDALAVAPGVVFDLRGYPEDNHSIIDHLLDQPEDDLWMHVPRVVAPDGQVAAWHDIGWHRRPATPHISAPVTFLISAEAISYAESVLSYVEAYDLGTLVGTTTAGANGDIIRFDTLGGFFVVFSGMRVTRHDGTRFHGDGVRPQVRVDRTIAGLRAGRDEVLEAGLRVVRARRPRSPPGA